MSSGISRAKVGLASFARIVLVFFGWCIILTLYVLVYGTLETSAVPVNIPPLLDVSTEQWDAGYFKATGSFKNLAAENDGDELTLQTNDITCIKTTNTCTVATADEYNGFMNLDVTDYDIDLWDAQQIRFSSSSSICADYTYVIDRVGQTVSGLRKKKAVIPDYALKSDLHPCDGLKEMRLSLVRGSQVHEQKVRAFEAKNLFGLHLFLVLLNAAYFVAIWQWEKRRRRKSAAKTLNPSQA